MRGLAIASIVASAVIASGCSKREPDSDKLPAPQANLMGTVASGVVADRIDGTLTVDGAPVAITTCRPGRGVTTFVELVTAKGTLRFENKQLSWDGKLLECTKLDRSWGGGQRPDGSAYFRGTLRFACGAISGDVTVDCGGITSTERAQLDANRQQMLDEQQQHQQSR